MKTTVSLAYEDYEALLKELARLTELEKSKSHEGMSLIELTVNGQKGPTNLSEVTGTVVNGGETTEIVREYPRGHLVNPVYRVLIGELNKMENAVVLVDSNIRKVTQSIRTLSTHDEDFFRQIRRIASENNLILIAKQEKGSEPRGG